MAYANLGHIANIHKQIGSKLAMEGGSEREKSEFYGLGYDATHTLGYIYEPVWTVYSAAGSGYIDLTFQVVKGQMTDTVTRAAAAIVFPFTFVVLSADNYNSSDEPINYALSVQTGTLTDGTKADGVALDSNALPVIKGVTDSNGIAKIRITRNQRDGGGVQTGTGAVVVAAFLDIAHPFCGGYADRVLLTDFS